MTNRVIKRPTAKRDLVDIFGYLEEHANLEAADRFLLSAEKTFDDLAQFPRSGAPQQTNNPKLAGMRKRCVHGFNNHIAFYFPLPDGIDVVRVIHAACDLKRLFQEDFLSGDV